MTTSTAQVVQNEITLKGSTAIVTEFFGFSISNILYLRGIYPPNSFTSRKKYGLNILVTNDERLKQYLGKVLSQLSQWLMDGMVQKLVVVIASVQTGETLERWGFNISTDENNPDQKSAKSETEVSKEIQALIRQITSSVTFLPLLQEECSFDLLVYTKKGTEIPTQWEESDPKLIVNHQEVRLRSFTTKVHTVDAEVSYKMQDDDV